MKKTLASLLFSGLLLANVATVSAQSNAIADHVIKPSFEGTISFALQIPQLGDDKLDMKCNVKGKKAMTEMDMGMQGSMHMYADGDTKKMTIVMDAMKMGFTADLPPEATGDAPVDEKEFDIHKTGKKETINGYAAEEYTAKVDDETSMDIWVTADAPAALREAMHSAMGAMQQKTSAKQARLHKWMAEKGMPVRTVMSKGDEKLATIDLVKVEAKSLDDALFIPSKDIKYQAMPKGMQGGGVD